jgi:mannose-1-phosphate guanylyltransferase
MQALVLVGGEGTRLRPLTLTRPKPTLQLVDRPFIRYLVDWLARHGFTEVIMACASSAVALREALGDGAGSPSIRYLEEPEPLGTAGPIRLAADEGLLEERFCVINGDLLTDLDLASLLRAHEETGATATVALYPVDDPSAYGLVRRAGGPPAPGAAPVSATGEVLEFLEKPEPGDFDTDEVNAGAYVLERDVVELIPPGGAVSIERDVFPRMVGRGLYGHRLEGYWMDIGTPERYLRATWDILERRVETDLAGRLSPVGLLIADDARVDPSASVNPPALVDRKAAVAAGAAIGSHAVVGRRVEVAERARLSSSVAMSDCRIGAGARVHGAILGPEVEVGEGALIEAGALIGEGARIGAGATVGPDERVGPGEVAS